MKPGKILTLTTTALVLAGCAIPGIDKTTAGSKHRPVIAHVLTGGHSAMAMASYGSQLVKINASDGHPRSGKWILIDLKHHDSWTPLHTAGPPPVGTCILSVSLVQFGRDTGNKYWMVWTRSSDGQKRVYEMPAPPPSGYRCERWTTGDRND